MHPGWPRNFDVQAPFVEARLREDFNIQGIYNWELGQEVVPVVNVGKASPSELVGPDGVPIDVQGNRVGVNAQIADFSSGFGASVTEDHRLMVDTGESLEDASRPNSTFWFNKTVEFGANVYYDNVQTTFSADSLGDVLFWNQATLVVANDLRTDWDGTYDGSSDTKPSFVVSLQHSPWYPETPVLTLDPINYGAGAGNTKEYMRYSSAGNRDWDTTTSANVYYFPIKHLIEQSTHKSQGQFVLTAYVRRVGSGSMSSHFWVGIPQFTASAD